jgi:hypothetical protein
MIDLVAVQRAVNILAQRAGLRVEYVAEQMFCTEPGGRLIVQRPSLSWTDAQLRIWRNAVCHEIGHWLPENRDIFPLLVKKKINTNDVFGACLNIVDDVRNDRNRTNLYPGTRHDKVFTTEYLIQNNWIPMIAKGAGNAETPNRIINTMIAGSVNVLAMDDAVLLKTYSAIRTVLDDEQKAWLQTMQDGGWLDRWYALGNAQSEWQYVSDILKEVFKMPADEVEQMQDQSGKGNDESDSEGEGEGDGEGDGESQDSGQGEGKEAKEGKQKKKRYDKNIVTVEYEKMMGQKGHDKNSNRMGGIHIDYNGYTEGRYEPHTPQSTKIGTAEEIHPHNGGSHWKTWIEGCIAQSNVDTLANKARRFLQTETRKHWSVNQRKGKLDTTKLTRLVTHDKNSSMKPAIFKQPSQKSALDTAISVLVDCSGSMEHEAKYPLAVAAAWGMIEICATLNIPIEVAAFTEYGSDKNYHIIFKEFGKKITKETIIDRAARAGEMMHSNADSDNILIAYNRILTRKEPKKLIMVMSDGSPASRRGDCMTYTKNVVKNIEKDHYVDIMGIGMLDSNVRLIYKNSYVIDSASQIPESLIEILKANVTV